MMTIRRFCITGALLAIATPLVGPVAAQSFPNRPLRIVVPYGPGGAPDILARLFSSLLQPAIGQPLVVDNRPGAGGNVGTDFVAKAPADGYTILMGTTANVSISPGLYTSMPYDSLKDLAPVALVAHSPLLLTISNVIPARDLKELIAYAKAHPGKLGYGTAGAGTIQHIAGAMFGGAAGLDLLHVPYKGTGQVMPDLIAGRVAMMFNSIAPMLPQVREGKLRAIGIASLKRSPLNPELPTLAESGLPGFDAAPWYAVFGPAGMPREAVSRLNQEIAKALGNPEVRDRYVQLGLEAASSTPEELYDLMRRDKERYAAIIKQHNIRLD